MKKLYLGFAILILLSVLTVGCGGSGNTGPVSDTSIINTLINRYATGIKAKNVDQVASCLTDPIIFNGNNMTLENFKSIALPMKWALITDFSISNVSITLIDPTNASASLTEKPVSIAGVVLIPAEFTFIKLGETWKISDIEEEI
ncbi:MAG TPA: hypothetical protein VHY08_05485 [Bacillota bacterium]|nr:hypothetical protein [Bacillota bacterium]